MVTRSAEKIYMARFFSCPCGACRCRLASIESEIAGLDEQIDRGVRDYAQRVVDGDAEKALKNATEGIAELNSKFWENMHMVKCMCW